MVSEEHLLPLILVDHVVQWTADWLAVRPPVGRSGRVIEGEPRVAVPSTNGWLPLVDSSSLHLLPVYGTVVAATRL